MENTKLTTIIADNRLMAETIADAFGAKDTHEGYYLGNGYAVTWTDGMIIEARFKADTSFVLSSNMEARLAYAHNFELTMRDVDSLVGYRKTTQDAQRLEVIKKLWADSNTVVNAMPPSFEGERAFLNLYYFLAMPVTLHRAWLPILSKRTIAKAIKHARKDNKAYNDWLSDSIFDFINRCIDDSDEDMTDDDSAEQFIERPEIKEETTERPDGRRIEEEDGLRIETVSYTPLYNACTLSMDAELLFGFSLGKTQQLALSLYAKKLISYPLIIQNAVPKSVWKHMKRNVRRLFSNPSLAHLAQEDFKPGRENIYSDGECIFNGYGIVTTGVKPGRLNPDEKKMYLLIAEKVIKAFTPMS